MLVTMLTLAAVVGLVAPVAADDGAPPVDSPVVEPTPSPDGTTPSDPPTTPTEPTTTSVDPTTDLGSAEVAVAPSGVGDVGASFAATVTGTVRSLSGVALGPSAGVGACPGAVPSIYCEPVGLQFLQPDGSYSITLPSAGTWNVRAGVVGPGGYPSGTSLGVDIALVDVEDGDDVVATDIHVAAGKVSGTVRDPSSNPVGAGVVVSVCQGDTCGQAGVTDGSGVYTTSWQPVGTFDLVIGHGNATWASGTRADVTVTDGVTTTGQDITLVTGGRIAGTVTDGSNPVANVVVGACVIPGTQWNCAYDATDAGGSYETGPLPPGTYDVTAIPTSLSPGLSQQTRTVVVTAGSTTTRDFALRAGGTIAGRVTDAFGNPIPAPLIGPPPFVLACPAPGHPGVMPNLCPGSVQVPYSDAAGNYEARLEDGVSYNVRAFTSGGLRSDERTVTLGSGEQRTGVDFTLIDPSAPPPDIEAGAPNGGDGNGDGVGDWLQPNVTSIPSVVPGPNGETQYLTFETSGLNNLVLAEVTSVVPPTSPPPPDGAQFPVGLLSYRIENLVPGEVVFVKVYLPAGVDWDPEIIGYYKLLNGSYEDFGAHVTRAGNVLTLELKDGDYGDADGVADGVIQDPFAVATAAPGGAASEGSVPGAIVAVPRFTG
jgi:hypothetical protein